MAIRSVGSLGEKASQHETSSIGWLCESVRHLLKWQCCLPQGLLLELLQGNTPVAPLLLRHSYTQGHRIRTCAMPPLSRPSYLVAKRSYAGAGGSAVGMASGADGHSAVAA